MAASARAGWMPNGAAEPPPPPAGIEQAVPAGAVTHDRGAAFAEAALNLLESLLAHF